MYVYPVSYIILEFVARSTKEPRKFRSRSSEHSSQQKQRWELQRARSGWREAYIGEEGGIILQWLVRGVPDPPSVGPLT